MVKNQIIFKVRKEDTTHEQQKKRQKLHKRVTWSKNLFEIRTISCKQSQGPRTGAVRWSEENRDEMVPNLIQETCSHRNPLEEESSESEEKSQLRIFGRKKHDQESLKFSFLDYCDDHQKQR